jgi:hypothetical protein
MGSPGSKEDVANIRLLPREDWDVESAKMALITRILTSPLRLPSPRVIPKDFWAR